MRIGRTRVYLTVFVMTLFSCKQAGYLTNGEMIYRTGKNSEGKSLLDKKNSQIKFIKSCQACHGQSGTLNRKAIIKFSYLSDPSRYAVPYSDSLFFRFLDEDLKSDGSHVSTGVKWKMSLSDKKDLLEFLKTM